MLSVKLFDFVFIKVKNYYPQMFLKEYKYIGKVKNIIRQIADNLKLSSDDSYKSDEERIDWIGYLC